MERITEEVASSLDNSQWALCSVENGETSENGEKIENG